MSKRGKARNRQLANQPPRKVGVHPAPATRGAGFYGEITRRQYISQLHDPDDVAKFEALFTGATEILFDEFQEQSKHRREIERLVVEGNVRQQNRGPIYGLIIVVLAIVVGALLTILGYDTVGIATLIGALAAPVIVFITGKTTQQSERQNKDRNAELSTVESKT